MDHALSRAPMPAAARRADLLTLAGRFPWLYLAGALGMLFLFLPIAMVILFSFNTGTTTRFPIEGLTLDWYDRVLRDEVILSATRASVQVGVGTMLLSALLGVPAALALSRFRFRGRSTLGAFFALPLAVPTLILAVALLTLLSTLKVPLSLGTVIVGHTVYTVPLMFLVVRARLLDMDPFLEESARDLGANGWQTFWKVTFPLIRSSIFGAMLLVFAQSFDMFVITLFTIGPQSTLPLVVWAMLRSGVNPSINAISTILIALTAIILVIASRFTRLTVDT
jgi:spermidine/putrescine transport system permease protein